MNARKLMTMLSEINCQQIINWDSDLFNCDAVALFTPEIGDDVVVAIMKNNLFYPRVLKAIDGVIRVTTDILQYQMDTRNTSIEQAIQIFNEQDSSRTLHPPIIIPNTDTPEDGPVKLCVDEEAKQTAMYVDEDFIPHNAWHHHDDSGTIFTPRYLEATNTTHEGIAWDIARDASLTINDVFVREYSEYGDISHYVRLPVMIKLLEYTDFCIENEIPFGVVRNMVYIKQAISDFLEQRKGQ